MVNYVQCEFISLCIYSSPALLEVLFQFASHCLQSDTPPVTPLVMTTWLFVCQQLYKTGAGLIGMEKYQLHSHIANRLQKVRCMLRCIAHIGIH